MNEIDAKSRRNFPPANEVLALIRVVASRFRYDIESLARSRPTLTCLATAEFEWASTTDTVAPVVCAVSRA
jgi:hypothetical protein